MERIERASIYKLVKKGKILIHGVSTLQAGGGIASEPYIWLEEKTPCAVIIERLI